MKLLTIMFALFLSANCNAQIMLKGYKCLFTDDHSLNCSEMYKGNDTFMLTNFHRDIYGELTGNTGTEIYDDPKNRLRVGLSNCFYKTRYIKTKDSLYIAAGKYPGNSFYYEIYIPEYESSLSVISNINDADFSEKSKWLLSQIRHYRGKPMYFINEKRETCRNENDLFETP